MLAVFPRACSIIDSIAIYIWAERLACHVNVNVVAAAAFWRRSPVDSNRAAAKGALCKILLRITANLTNVFAQLKARHSASQHTPI